MQGIRSYSNDPTPSTGSIELQPSAASSSNEPKPIGSNVPKAWSGEQPSDEDIEQIHQAPILAPSKTHITVLTEKLEKLFNSGKTKYADDLKSMSQIIIIKPMLNQTKPNTTLQ